MATCNFSGFFARFQTRKWILRNLGVIKLNGDSSKGIILYNDYLTHFQLLSDADLGCLVRALLTYASSGALPENLAPETEVSFSFIRLQIDRDREKWEESHRRRVAAASKRYGEKYCGDKPFG